MEEEASSIASTPPPQEELEESKNECVIEAALEPKPLDKAPSQGIDFSSISELFEEMNKYQKKEETFDPESSSTKEERKAFYPEFSSAEEENEGMEYLIESTVNLYGGRNTKIIKDLMKETSAIEKRDALNSFYEKLISDYGNLGVEKGTGNYNKLVTLEFKTALRSRFQPSIMPSFIENVEWEIKLHPSKRVGFNGFDLNFTPFDPNESGDDNLVNGFGLTKTQLEILRKKFPSKTDNDLKHLRVGRVGECSNQIDTKVLKEHYPDEVIDSLYNILLFRDSVWKVQDYKSFYKVLKLNEPSNLEFFEMRTQLVTALSNKNICYSRLFYPELFDLVQFFLEEFGRLSDNRDKFGLMKNNDCMLYPFEFMFFRKVMLESVDNSSLDSDSKNFLSDCIKLATAESLINKYKPFADFFNNHTHTQLLQRGFNPLNVEIKDILPIKAFVSDLNYINDLFGTDESCKFKKAKDSILDYGINNTIEYYKSIFDEYIKINYNLSAESRKRF